MRKEVKEYIGEIEKKAAKAAEGKKLQMWAYHVRMVEVLTVAFKGVRGRDASVDVCRAISGNAIHLCPQIEDARVVADLWAAGVHARKLLDKLGGYCYRPTLGWFRKRAGVEAKEGDNWRGRYGVRYY